MPSSDEVLQLASHLREKATLSVLNQTYDRNYRSAAAF
jgi:hypothetical protein